MEGDKKPEGKRTGLATLGGGGSSSASTDKKKNNEYYAGGHASGVAVIGRGDPKDDETGDQVVERLTKQAKESGAVVDEHKKAEQPKFQGQGASLSGQRVEGAKAAPKEVVRVLTMYADGFTVDSGPFRLFSDPANKVFLDEIGRGLIPSELEQEAQGGQLHVDLVDKRTQKFEPPKQEKPKVQAFVGHGNALGGPAAAAAAAAPVAVVVGGEMTPVDSSKPTTNIQFRTKSGARVTGTFNLTHTVGDLFRFLRSKGESGSSLVCNIPRRVLGEKEMHLTVGEAQLGGAALILQ
jgi:UBX domain-containing protein 1